MYWLYLIFPSQRDTVLFEWFLLRFGVTYSPQLLNAKVKPLGRQVALKLPSFPGWESGLFFFAFTLMTNPNRVKTSKWSSPV